VIAIEGHCDDSGSAKYNMMLGARRARAVRDALVRLGAPSTIHTTAYRCWSG